MSQLKSCLLICMLSALNCSGAVAQDDEQSTTTTTTVVTKPPIITPAPKSVSCTSVSAHWEGNIWIDAQTVCTYENRTEGAAWVQDYWSCTAFTVDGNCTSWQLVPGHWVQK